jgi:metal-responsive CopG/Arc/MetJ family transcriptional regulator
MKTAISLADDTFERVTRRARELGMSRSELFARAAVSYLDGLDARSLTGRVNAAIDIIVDQDESADIAVEVGHRVLAVSDEW